MSVKRANIQFIKISSFLMNLNAAGPIFSLYLVSKGLNISQILFAQSFYSVVIILTEVPTGALADKFGHKLSVILGCLLNIFAFATYIYFPELLLVGYGLSATGDSFVSGSLESLNADSSAPKRHRRNWASVLSYGIYSAAIGSSLAGILFWRFGNRAFVLLIFISLIAKFWAILTMLQVSELSRARSRRGHDSHFFIIIRSALTQIRQSPILRTLTIIKTLTLSAQYVLYAVYQPYFVENKVPAIFIGLVMTAGYLSNGKLFSLTQKLERNLTLQKSVFLLPFTMALTYLIFSLTHNPYALVFVFIILQAQFNLLDPIISDFVNQEAIKGTRATVISGISFVESIANTISKLALGMAFAAFGLVGLLRIQALYLILGATISYFLIKCLSKQKVLAK